MPMITKLMHTLLIHLCLILEKIKRQICIKLAAIIMNLACEQYDIIHAKISLKHDNMHNNVMNHALKSLNNK